MALQRGHEFEDGSMTQDPEHDDDTANAPDLGRFARLEELEAEREKLGQWLAKLEDLRGETSEEVLATVRGDYLARRRALDEELEPLRREVDGLRGKLEERLASGKEALSEALKVRDVLELRSRIGEFSGDPEAQARLKAARDRAAAAEKEVAALSEQVDELKALGGASPTEKSPDSETDSPEASESPEVSESLEASESLKAPEARETSEVGEAESANSEGPAPEAESADGGASADPERPGAADDDEEAPEPVASGLPDPPVDARVEERSAEVPPPLPALPDSPPDSAGPANAAPAPPREVPIASGADGPEARPAWGDSSGWSSQSFDSVGSRGGSEAQAPESDAPAALAAPGNRSISAVSGASRPFPVGSVPDAAKAPQHEDRGGDEPDDSTPRPTTTSRYRLLGATMAISRAHLIPELPTTHNRVICLVSTDGDDVYYILEPHMMVGRHRTAGNQIVIEDAAISRQHARIQQNEAGDFVLTDLESSNGTFVNDERITSHTLDLEDTVQFGPAGFVVSLLSEIAKPGGS
ncbi:MAG: FHA domain-containing protein [Acidobacteriota bacterium]